MAISQMHDRKRGKNLAVALALAGFMLLIFIVTLVKLTESIEKGAAMRANSAEEKTVVVEPAEKK